MSSRAQFTDISIEKYSERCIVVRGETRKYKEDLKKLGGKYNGRLRSGPGWIFPISLRNDVESFIHNGVRLVSKQEEKDGELRTQAWERERGKDNTRETNRSPTPTLHEYAVMLSIVKETAVKVDRIERAIMFLLTEEQKKCLGSVAKTQAKTQAKIPKRKGMKRVKKVIRTRKAQPSSNIVIESDSESDSEVIIPRKRLLKR